MLPGAHTPWHDAEALVAAMQAWLPQSTGLPHWPPVHVCRPLPEHCVLPEVHEPEHAPAVQAPLAQETAVPQLPLESQVCTPLPTHWTASGTQVPPHDATPEALTTHAAEHGTDAPQLPVPSQVSTPLTAHCVVPWAQTPVQPPLTQVWLPQSDALPHWPVPSHTWTALPVQTGVPGVQTAPASASALPVSVTATSPTVVSGPVSFPPSAASSPAAVSETVMSISAPSGDPSSPLLLPTPSGEPSVPLLTEVMPPFPHAATKPPARRPDKAKRIQGRDEVMGTSNRYMVGAGLLPKKDLMTIAEKRGRRTPVTSWARSPWRRRGKRRGT